MKRSNNFRRCTWDANGIITAALENIFYIRFFLGGGNIRMIEKCTAERRERLVMVDFNWKFNSGSVGLRVEEPITTSRSALQRDESSRLGRLYVTSWTTSHVNGSFTTCCKSFSCSINVANTLYVDMWESKMKGWLTADGGAAWLAIGFWCFSHQCLF